MVKNLFHFYLCVTLGLDQSLLLTENHMENIPEAPRVSNPCQAPPVHTEGWGMSGKRSQDCRVREGMELKGTSLALERREWGHDRSSP